MSEDLDNCLRRLADGAGAFRPPSRQAQTERRSTIRARWRLGVAALVAPLLAPAAYAVIKVALSDAANTPQGRLDLAFWRDFGSYWVHAILPGFYLAALVFCAMVAGVSVLLPRLNAWTVMLVGAGLGAIFGLLLSSIQSSRPHEALVAATATTLGSATAGAIQAPAPCLLGGLSWRAGWRKVAG